jgi:hypothetical protein
VAVFGRDRWSRGEWVFPVILELIFLIPVVFSGYATVTTFEEQRYGVHGTLTVEDCLQGPCEGTFVSDDGGLRIANLPASGFYPEGDEIQGWVTGPGARQLDMSVDWHGPLFGVGLFLVLALVVGYALFSGRIYLRMRRRADDPRGSPFAAVAVAARDADLGTHLGSTRWSRYRYVVIGLIGAVFAAGFGGGCVEALREGYVLGGAVIGVLAVLFGVTAVFYVGVGAAGVNRALHMFEKGLVVTHGRRCDVFAWRDVVADGLMTDNEDGTTRGVWLRRGDGRRLEIDLAEVAQPVRSAIAAQRVQTGS